MYKLEIIKVCYHATRSCAYTDSHLAYYILLLAIIFHVYTYYTPIPTTLFISTDNLLVLLEDAHESQSSTKPLVKTQERSPKSGVPQSIGQDVIDSLTSDEEQSSPVQTGADKGL